MASNCLQSVVPGQGVSSLIARIQSSSIASSIMAATKERPSCLQAPSLVGGDDEVPASLLLPAFFLLVRAEGRFPASAQRPQPIPCQFEAREVELHGSPPVAERQVVCLAASRAGRPRWSYPWRFSRAAIAE